MRHVLLACIGALVICLAPVRAQTGYKPTPDNLAAREWFQDARFGMFVHWGVYSVLADGEWVMNNRKIPVADYEKLPAMFNPIDFNAAEWVSLAKAAGMKYITITSKHHDGFAMFDSKVSDYNIVARTPYKRLFVDLSTGSSDRYEPIKPMESGVFGDRHARSRG